MTVRLENSVEKTVCVQTRVGSWREQLQVGGNRRQASVSGASFDGRPPACSRQRTEERERPVRVLAILFYALLRGM